MGGKSMGVEVLNRYPMPADGGGADIPPLRPTANYDDEPERDPDPTGVLSRAHTERYGSSAASRFIGVSPDAIIRAARIRHSAGENPQNN
jgi:hypothetical protein